MNGPEASQANIPASAKERRAFLATCVAAAAKAAEVVRTFADRRSELTWENKSRADFVSDADRGAEAALTAIIRQRHPEAVLVAEESSPDEALGRGLVFVADPLDGTTNFLHGFPWYAVSIAALVDGVPVAGAILNAATGELFSAVAGGGARRGGQPIQVSTVTDPLRALVGTGFPFKDEAHIEVYFRALPAIMRGTAGIRRPGSAALDLADVACGRFDAFWELRLAPWDIAAGILLVQEAGGIVTDIRGGPIAVGNTSVLAGNPAMHAWLAEILRSAGT